MTFPAYLADRAAALALSAFAAVGVAILLMAVGAGAAAAALGGSFVAACAAAALGIEYARRRRFYRELDALSQCLERPYLASALMEEPSFPEGAVVWRALGASSKVAADEVAAHRRQAEDYRAYIELWIHEVKTPIAAAGLMAARMFGPDAMRLKGEVDRIEALVDQALYYARSTSLANDFSLREMVLADAAREAVKKHARYLIECGVAPKVELSDDVRVFADAKWLAFIVGQLVTNAAKYGASSVRFSARVEGEGAMGARTVFEVADDGPGIPAADVPRVFERGFTGSNGRKLGSSTGMGLYLVAELCAKMGLGVALASEEGVGTRVLLSFPHDRRRLDAQRGARMRVGKGRLPAPDDPEARRSGNA